MGMQSRLETIKRLAANSTHRKPPTRLTRRDLANVKSTPPPEHRGVVEQFWWNDWVDANNAEIDGWLEKCRNGDADQPAGSASPNPPESKALFLDKVGDRLLYPEEVIPLLGLDKGRARPDEALSSLRRMGQIGYVRVGRSIMYTKEHVRKFVAANSVRARRD